MRRPFPLLILLLCVPCCAFAQADPTWQVQLKAGPQFVRLSDPIGPFNGPYTGREVSGLGFVAGVSLGVPHRSAFGLRMDLLYSARNTGYIYDERQGRRGPPRMEVEWGERRTRMHLLEVPLLLAWYGPPGLRVEAGPAVAWLLHAQEHAVGERSVSGAAEAFDVVQDRTPDMAGLEWAAVLGVEVAGPHGLALAVRGWQGFTDLDAGHGALPSQGQAWQFMLSYAFHGRKPDRHH